MRALGLGEGGLNFEVIKSYFLAVIVKPNFFIIFRREVEFACSPTPPSV